MIYIYICRATTEIGFEGENPSLLNLRPRRHCEGPPRPKVGQFCEKFCTSANQKVAHTDLKVKPARQDSTISRADTSFRVELTLRRKRENQKYFQYV